MKPTIEPAPPPLCKNCSYFIERADEKDLARCSKFEMTELVYGERFYVPCSDVRSPNAPCGTAAKLFQRKPFTVKIVEPAGN